MHRVTLGQLTLAKRCVGDGKWKVTSGQLQQTVRSESGQLTLANGVCEGIYYENPNTGEHHGVSTHSSVTQ